METIISARVQLRRRPAQRHSRFTYDVILEAFPLILDHQSFETCTSNEIAEVAGVGIGTFYEYFANKETVLAVWLREQYKKLVAKLDDATLRTSFLPLEAALLQMVEICFDHHAVHPGAWHQTITLGRLISKPSYTARHNQAAIECWERFLSLHIPAHMPANEMPILARGIHICLQAHIEHALTIDHQWLYSQNYRREALMWLMGRFRAAIPLKSE
jgi:AcrR family transcriptional regulator